MENTVSEIKVYTIINSRLKTARENISKSKDIAVETPQNSLQREKMLRKRSKSISDV